MITDLHEAARAFMEPRRGTDSRYPDGRLFVARCLSPRLTLEPDRPRSGAERGRSASRAKEAARAEAPCHLGAKSAVSTPGLFHRTVSLAVVVIAAVFPLAPLRAADLAAETLVAKLRAAQPTTGVLIRTRLVGAEKAGERPVVTQLRVQGRRDGTATRWRFQALWPAGRRGQAVCFEKPAAGAVTGFWFEPPEKITPLTPEMLAGPFFASDLCIEDLAEDFWDWPGPVVSGEETIGAEKCPMLDFHPPADGAASTVSLVRVWISPAKTIPVRIEKLGGEGRVLKRFVFQKPVQRDGVWTPTMMVVQIPGSASETTLEISRGDRDVEIPLAEFSPEAVQHFARALEQEAAEAANQNSHSVHK